MTSSSVCNRMFGTQCWGGTLTFVSVSLSFLPSSLSGVNCLAYDEAIIAQQDRIQQEVRKH